MTSRESLRRFRIALSRTTAILLFFLAAFFYAPPLWAHQPLGMVIGDPAALNTNAAGDSGGDEYSQVTTDGAGNWVIAGYTDGNLAGSVGRFDVVLLTYSPDGALLGIRQLGTPEDDGADEWAEENLYLAVRGDTLALTGLTMGQLGDTVSAGGSDAFLTTMPVE